MRARVAGLGRLVGALTLLALLWVGTIQGVERGSREADDRRAADREAVAAGFAASIGEWLQAGRDEALTLSRNVSAAPGPASQAAISSFLATQRTFARSAVVFGGSGFTVTAASPGRAVLLGLEPRPCTRTVPDADAVADADLNEIVAAARGSATPVVSGFFDVPGNCKPGVAIAASSGSAVTVVFGDTADAAARVAAGSLIADPLPTDAKPAGTRLLIVTRDVAWDPQLGIVSAPQRLDALAREAAQRREPQRARYTIGDTGDAEVLAAVAPVSDGWVVALEQDAAIFDIELQNRPSVFVASILTVVFAVVFGLLAVFDLRRQRAQRRSDVAKNAFFSVAGHELRTPLTSLKGFAEMLAVNWDQLDDERRRTLVDRMAPQTRRLDRLVERLLVAASIQAETHTRPQMREIDPLPVVEEVVRHFREEAPLHTFIVQPPDTDVVALADPRALDQVMQHLIENAVKYSSSGGRVWVGIFDRPGAVDIVVQDEGVGLPSDHRHIFDRFVQGEAVTKRVHDEGGVGLGLFIVRTLVADMGGTVMAQPVPEGGARFVVTLGGGMERRRRPSVQRTGSRSPERTSP